MNEKALGLHSTHSLLLWFCVCSSSDWLAPDPRLGLIGCYSLSQRRSEWISWKRNAETDGQMGRVFISGQLSSVQNAFV